MKIIELVLDDDQITGIEAISVVENPAIEEDFIALKNEEVKLAEVSNESESCLVLYLFPTNQYTDVKAMMSTTYIFLKVR